MIDEVVDPSLQLYVPPPVAVNVVLLPLQMLLDPLMVGTKLLPTVTCTEALPVQPPLLTVTV